MGRPASLLVGALQIIASMLLFRPETAPGRVRWLLVSPFFAPLPLWGVSGGLGGFDAL